MADEESNGKIRLKIDSDSDSGRESCIRLRLTDHIIGRRERLLTTADQAHSDSGYLDSTLSDDSGPEEEGRGPAGPEALGGGHAV